MNTPSRYNAKERHWRHHQRQMKHRAFARFRDERDREQRAHTLGLIRDE